MVGHQLGGLLAAGPTGVPHAVMVHPKPKAHGDTETALVIPAAAKGTVEKLRITERDLKNRRVKEDHPQNVKYL